LDQSKATRILIVILLLSSVVTLWFIPNSSGQESATSFLTSSYTGPTTVYLPTVTVAVPTGLTTLAAPVTFQLFTGFCYFAFLPLFDTTGTFNITYSVDPSFISLTLYVLDAQGSYRSWQTAFDSGLSVNMAQNRCYPANYALTPPYEATISGSGSLQTTLSSLSLSLGKTYGIVLTDVAIQSGPPTASINIGPVQSLTSVTESTSIALTSTVTAATTLMFVGAVQGSPVQSYGTWIAAVVTIAILILATLWFLSRKRAQKTG